MNAPVIHWTIYNKPADFPASVVARQSIGDRPTGVTLITADIDELRDIVKRLLGEHWTCIGWQPNDDPTLIETWS